jgi:hypothetical protein
LSKDIGKRVLQTVGEALMPVSIEYIAQRVNVGWGTALRYALELLADGKINGVKTTKSWVFWIEQKAGE